MALITEQNKYIKLTAEIDGDNVRVNDIVYLSKEDREKEKTYQLLLEELVVKVENKINELYVDMMVEAERIGYVDADWQDEQGVNNYVNNNPSFKIKFDEYNKLFYELYNIKNYINFAIDTLDSIDAIKGYFGEEASNIIEFSRIQKSKGSFTIRELPEEGSNVTEYAYNKVKKLGLFGETMDV